MIFDRIVRSQVHATLPVRDFVSGPRIAVDIAVRSRTPDTRIFRPHRRIADSVDAGLLHGAHLSVEVLRPLTRGFYRIATRDDATNQDVTTCVSVNGPAEESNLTALSRAAFTENVQATQVRWIGQDEAPTLAGVAIQGQTMWRWLIGGVILMLLAENDRPGAPTSSEFTRDLSRISSPAHPLGPTITKRLLCPAQEQSIALRVSVMDGLRKVCPVEKLRF